MMDAVLKSLMSGLPALLGQYLTTAAIYVAGLAMYMWLTPYHELKLIRQGNIAAAIIFTGAIIGLALPLGATLAHSVNVVDIALWGAVSAALQGLTFGFISFALREVTPAVERGDVAIGLLVGALQLGVGIINAGAMSS